MSEHVCIHEDRLSEHTKNIDDLFTAANMATKDTLELDMKIDKAIIMVEGYHKAKNELKATVTNFGERIGAGEQLNAVQQMEITTMKEDVKEMKKATEKVTNRVSLIVGVGIGLQFVIAFIPAIIRGMK